MTITIVIINPRKEMGLECEWRHARKQWAENLGILKKTSVEFYCRPVELGTRLGPVQLGVDFGYVKSWSRVKTMVLRSWSLTMEFCRSLLTEIVKTTRCAKHLSFVSIEWLRTVSLFLSCQRTKLRSQEVNKRSYLNNGVACVFESAYCVFAYV